jgi:asparagine synthase (glutamine-hydrolysing)
MESDAIDLKYAKEVAEFLGTDHTEVIISKKDVLEAYKEVIYHLETWDITTIRASIGMYLVCKYIREKTDIKVLLTGEVADELFGYKYTDFAPSEEDFQKEAKKRIDEIFMYDVLRADRCLSAHSLEARVPFGDRDFVDYVMAISPSLKVNTTGVGKYLLRKAFEKGDYLPHSILFREKAAFSDAVGHSLVDYLKEFAGQTFTEDDVREAKLLYPYCPPFTQESLLYRKTFEDFFQGKADLIKDFWMPNKNWKNCDVKDPSARILPNYGASGH